MFESKQNPLVDYNQDRARTLSLSYIYIYIYICVCVCVCVCFSNTGVARKEIKKCTEKNNMDHIWRALTIITVGKWKQRSEFQPRTCLLQFHFVLMSLGKAWIRLFPPANYWKIIEPTEYFGSCLGNQSERRKTQNSKLDSWFIPL